MTLIGAPSLSAAPPVPIAPASDDTVIDLRPAFSWSAATSDATLDRYEVRIRPGDLVVASVPATEVAATATVDLPNDADITWYVVAVDSQGTVQESGENRITVATPPSAPSITSAPSGPTSDARPTFQWRGTRPSSEWAIVNADDAVVQTGVSPAGSGEVTLATPLIDGQYTFRVVQRNIVGQPGAAATRSLTIDTVAPAGPLVTARQSAIGQAPSRSFAWSGIEPGARVEWQVVGAGKPVVPSSPGVGDAVTVPPLSTGSYVFQARQIDAAGNPSPWTAVPFAVLAGSTPTAAGASFTPTMRLPSSNWRRMHPRRGARISSRRPLLRWRKGPARVTVYNVQVFRVRAGGRRLQKIYSTFPRRTRLRMPKRRRLVPGACYLWRVWPFVGQRFTARPLGVSHFCVRPSSKRRSVAA